MKKWQVKVSGYTKSDDTKRHWNTEVDADTELSARSKAVGEARQQWRDLKIGMVTCEEITT